jgi:hypothetical protein
MTDDKSRRDGRRIVGYGYGTDRERRRGEMVGRRARQGLEGVNSSDKIVRKSSVILVGALLFYKPEQVPIGGHI